RNRKMRLEQRWYIGRHDAHRVTAADAASNQRRREASATRIEFGIGVSGGAMDDRCFVGIDGGATFQEVERRQRPKIGSAAVEPDVVLVQVPVCAVFARRWRSSLHRPLPPASFVPASVGAL